MTAGPHQASTPCLSVLATVWGPIWSSGVPSCQEVVAWLPCLTVSCKIPGGPYLSHFTFWNSPCGLRNWPRLCGHTWTLDTGSGIGAGASRWALSLGDEGGYAPGRSLRSCWSLSPEAGEKPEHFNPSLNSFFELGVTAEPESFTVHVVVCVGATSVFPQTSHFQGVTLMRLEPQPS